MNEPQSDASPADAGPLRQELGLLDGVSIIISIVIGSAIYEKAPQIAASSTGWMIAWRQQLVGSGLRTDESLRPAAITTVLGVWLLGQYVRAQLDNHNPSVFPEVMGALAGDDAQVTELGTISAEKMAELMDEAGDVPKPPAH